MSWNLRKWGFWSLDWFRGSPVADHYRSVRQQLEATDQDKFRAEREETLRVLLQHAVDTVPYYQGMGQAENLLHTHFPIVNKNLIRAQLDRFLSTAYRKEELVGVTTSGSTGTPFTVFQDRRKRHRHTADNIFLNEQAGCELGSRLYYLRVWNKLVDHHPVHYWMQNIRKIEASRLDGPSLEQELFRPLQQDTRTKSLLAYASTYEAIARYLQSAAGTTGFSRVNTIISMSETLPEPVRRFLADYFHCPVVSRYSNMECGFIAQQMHGADERYQVNTASYHVEVLELGRDVPVAPGQRGRIVVTDLYNYAMPLIRYDTGDIGILGYGSSRSDEWPPFLERIEGRRVDFISDVHGNLISPHTITNSMWMFPEIHQFQLIQTGDRFFLLKLNVDDGFERESEMINTLKDYLGKEAEIRIEFVQEIPPLSSGKRKKIVNEYGIK